MNAWLQPLFAASNLTWLVSVILLTLAFWQLRQLAPSPATLAGFAASVTQLLIWLFHHVVGLLTLVSVGGFDPWKIYRMPHVTEIIGIATTASYSVTLLALAWLLHQGMPPKPSSP